MEGFLAPRPMRPGTLGLVVLGHLAVLTAVVLAKNPTFIRKPDVTMVSWIPDTPEPPPIPEPQPQAKTPPSRIDTPTRIVDLTPTLDTVRIVEPPLPPMPPLPPLPPARNEVVAPPPPPAVFVEPQADPRASFQPAYPPALQRAEVEGKAVVRVLVGSDGRVHAVEIVAADDPAFGEATRRQALRAWRFRPATRDGVAVESWRTMTVHFRMNA